MIVIHHCGTDSARPRGHTSLTGAADVQIAVKRDSTGNIVAEVEYAKDMPEGSVIASRLEVVELGVDQDGDQLTSCVVLPVEDGAVPSGKPRSARIPKSAQTALRALKEAIEAFGEAAPASNHIPTKVRVTTFDRWREYAYRMGISTGEDRARQKAFKNASAYLIDSGDVAVWDSHVWVAR